MEETFSINGEVLAWARKSAGLSIEEVATKLKRKSINAELVTAWEQGLAVPTYSQLERLAYEIYKRPLAIFFFPTPPDEESPEHSFRTLPEYEIEHLSPVIRFLLRKAKVYQLNLYELYDHVNPSRKKIIQDFTVDTSSLTVELAQSVREYLSVSLDDQLSFKNYKEAFKHWREALENVGVFVFKDAFKEDNFSGFCLYDEEFPIIYVNNSKPDTRQIFTLFHELAHLLFGTGGVDMEEKEYIDQLASKQKKIEFFCNSFAGEFLVPSEHFDALTENISIDDENISRFAELYSVSREVILRKFLESDRIDRLFYQERIDSWSIASSFNQMGKKKKTGGGDYYRSKGVYLGKKYIEKVFSMYYQNRINVDSVADYLGVKVKNVSGIEALL